MHRCIKSIVLQIVTATHEIGYAHSIDSMVLKCARAKRTHNTRMPQVPANVAIAGMSVEPSPRQIPLLTSIKPSRKYTVNISCARITPKRITSGSLVKTPTSCGEK